MEIHTWICVPTQHYMSKRLTLLCSIYVHQHNKIHIRGQTYLQATENTIAL